MNQYSSLIKSVLFQKS